MKNPNTEGLKEVARWIVLFLVSSVISWFITETLKQITAVPEFFSFKVWVFTYSIPLRSLLSYALTFGGRWLDKYLHENSKQTKGYALGETKPSGLLWF